MAWSVLADLFYISLLAVEIALSQPTNLQMKYVSVFYFKTGLLLKGGDTGPQSFIKRFLIRWLNNFGILHYILIGWLIKLSVQKSQLLIGQIYVSSLGTYINLSVIVLSL